MVQDSSRKIFMPDTSQMVPFKPQFKWIIGEHRVSGGSFPLPVAAIALCQSLPPPDCYQGPFVMVDRLMDVFMTMKLPHSLLPENSNDVNGTDRIPSFVSANSNFVKNSQFMSGFHEQISRNKVSRSRSDDEDETIIPPPMNIYTERQLKKLKHLF